MLFRPSLAFLKVLKTSNEIYEQPGVSSVKNFPMCTMTQKLQKCRSRNFAIHFVDNWMNLKIKGGSKKNITNTISKYLAETFSQWNYALVVYPPHHGGHKHWTNYDIHRFRHDGHNIVLHFYPLSDSKACKDPEPIKWCNNHRRDPKGTLFENYSKCRI